MRRIILLSIAVVFIGCSKNTSVPETSEETAKKYDVHFTVSDFAQAVGTMQVSPGKATTAIGDTLKNYTDNLYYRLYDGTGKLVRFNSQNSSIFGYGKVDDQLSAGSYKAFFAGVKGTLSFTGTLNFTGDGYMPSNSVWDDTFTSVVEFTVGSSPVNQSVRLQRAVAGLEVTLTDAIPSNIGKINILITPEANFTAIAGGMNPDAIGKTFQYTISTSDYGTRNKKFFAYVNNTQSAVKVTIRAYDKNNSYVTEKVITDVSFSKNQRTLLSGALFPGTPSPLSSFTIVVNPSWTTSPVKQF